MPDSVIRAQPPLEFIPPNLQPGLVKSFGKAIPWVAEHRNGIVGVETLHIETLVELYRQFQAKETRFIIAFRHPSTVDPLSLFYLLAQSLPKAAAKTGIALELPCHAYFLYDRGVPLWAGSLVGWLLPRAGGISIQRGRLDRQSLKTARDKFANGEQPMMVAPEGATNGLSELVSPLEPGVAQMAFWCLDDLRAAGRDEKVVVLPLGLKYEYLTPPWEGVDRLLTDMEADCGLPVLQGERYERLLRIGNYLLEVLESYYERFYRHETTQAGDISERLRNLLESGLKTSEEYFGIQAKGSLTDRCRRIEGAGWDRIYREDLKDKSLTPLQRGLADRAAEEADRRMWHMRIVENFVAVTGKYVQENPTPDRFAETISLLSKTVSRLKGIDVISPPSLGKRRAKITIGIPILVNDLYPAYLENKQGARKSVSELTQRLQHDLEAMTNGTASGST